MSERGFYVGYLAMPTGHARFLRVFVSALVVGVSVGAAVLAGAQRDPGGGVWENAASRSWTGTMIDRPYPLLVGDDGVVYLLVEVGKRGPRAGLAGFDGRRVTVSGWELHRDGRRMIELEPGDGAVRALGEGAAIVPTVVLGAEGEFAGEILDAKCYLGAMKPGDGKAHKACATLCVGGGIPPMLYTRGSDGAARCVLLIGSDGGAANGLVLPYLGEAVRVRGRAGALGSLEVFMLDSDGVSRR